MITFVGWLIVTVRFGILFRVEETADGTKLTLVMDANAYKLLPKLMNPIMKYFIKKELDKDMDAVKSYCEN